MENIISKSDDYGILNITSRNLDQKTKITGLSEEKHNGRDTLSLHADSKIKDVICFSHLRWDFVFQRPQHLLSRWGKECRVFYIEEPVAGKIDANFLKTVYSNVNSNITIISPHVKENLSEKEIHQYMKQTVNEIIKWYQIRDYLLWYLTPMAVPYTADLSPELIVYDSMDELSCFKGAHPEMLKNEDQLFKIADVVFTGGHNLYEFKKGKHQNIHPFPSSIDQHHFESGLGGDDPADQREIPQPRAGFFGVIDERLDIELLEGLALALPDFQFIMVGPVVKIDPASLPRQKNIHYLGMKSYNELPFYLAHWDVAILPFAKNESTRFISPTKTPEYLSARKPVVSTSIRDIVVPYGEKGMVAIADNVKDFSSAIIRVLKQKDNRVWLDLIMEHLRNNSWDLTFAKMKEIIYYTLRQKETSEEELFQNYNMTRISTGHL